MPEQLHATLFDAHPSDLNAERWGRDYQEGVDAGEFVPVLVTGHLEKSPYNPVYAYRHLRGTGYDVEAGVEQLAELLVDETDVDFGPSNRAIQLAGQRDS